MINNIATRFQRMFHIIRRSIQRVRMIWYSTMFRSHGSKFRFDPDSDYSYKNISVGDNVNLGLRCIIWSAKAQVLIGNRVFTGPDVAIFGGNHDITLSGRFMIDMMLPENGRDIVIDDDVWIGARVLILTGVHIGRGAVIGAGAIITKNIPPYAVVGGSPAKVLKFRGNIEQIMRHERSLYDTDKRLTRETLEQNIAAGRAGKAIPQ